MSDLYLRSGIFLAPFHNHDENPTLSIERDLELLEHLDRLNYHEAWIGEHHSGGFELIACPEMFIAAAAQRTRHIRLGTGVVSLPYHNPFMLADRMVQLDHMTRGRAMFGVGPGALVHDALKIGIDPGDQRQMMNEALDVIVRAAARRDRQPQDRLVQPDRRAAAAAPLHAADMELAVAAARSPSGSLAAGKYGIGMLSIGGTSAGGRWSATPRTGASTRRPRAPTGMSPTARTGASSACSTSPRRASRRARTCSSGCRPSPIISATSRPSRSSRPMCANPIEWLIETGTACIGTPDDAIAYIERLIKGSGGFGVLCELAQNWADWDATKRHYELMARFVHPHFQKSRDLLRGSYDYAAGHRADFVGQAGAAIQKEIDRHARRAAAPAKQEAAE